MSVDSRHKSSAESYMKHIVKYMSEQSKNSIGTGDLSRLIGVTPGSATSMLKKLAADGYLQYRPHRGCTLTGKGRLFGIAMLRRHRLLETFLVKTLHYDPAEVHDEAERLEYAVSDTFLERVDAALGHPDRDPHGDEIPKKGQKSLTVTDMALCTAPEFIMLTVSRVSGNSGRMQYLYDMGIMPGKEIALLHQNREAGTVQIEVDERKITVGVAVLDDIHVYPPCSR